MNNKSFTLIEILVVVLVIGIVSSFVYLSTEPFRQDADQSKVLMFSTKLNNSLAENIIGEWNLSEGSGSNVYDSSDNKNAGAITGGAVWQSRNNCVLDRCLLFDGIDDCIYASDIPVYEDLTDEMSAFIWAKGNEQISKSFFGQGGAGVGINKRSWRLMTGDWSFEDKLAVYLSDDGTASFGHRKYYYTDSAIAFDNYWHHVGFTWNSGTLKLYVDGKEASVTKDNDDAITSLYNTDADVSIGCDVTIPPPATYLFAGYLDEAYIFNKQASITEIDNIYLSGLNKLFINGQIAEEEYLDKVKLASVE